MTRRSLLQSLIVGVAAKFSRKPIAPSRISMTDNFLNLYLTAYVEDINFITGDHWIQPLDVGRQCRPINRLAEALEAAREKPRPLPESDPATFNQAFHEVNKMLDRWNNEPFHRDAT